jgi:hypothetical protein
MGVERNALRIRRRAAFCWSCSLWARVFCPVHQISAPKSDLERTHARYSEHVVEGDKPVSYLTRLQRALKDLDVAVSFNFTWCENESLRSNCIPIYLTTSFLPSFIPGITEVPLGSVMLVSVEWVSLQARWKCRSSDFESSKATALLAAQVNAVLAAASRV